MTGPENATVGGVSEGESSKNGHGLDLKVEQLESEVRALERETKAIRQLLERAMEHRQKSHSELVLLLAGLVSKLPINEVGVVVSRLVEHNAQVGQFHAAIGRGAMDTVFVEQPVLQTLEQTRKGLLAAIKPVVEELIQSEPPFEKEMLASLSTQPDNFFSPGMVRANRCFLKGHVPRERIVREFGNDALALFNDLTTDPKLNPRPKAEEIVLCFKDDFTSQLELLASLPEEKKRALLELYQRVQRSKGSTEPARLQKGAFQRLSFLIELLHYYEHQNTEAPDVLFAQRLPALVEQLVITGPDDPLDEKLILSAEQLLGFVISPDHRRMIINNIGKGGGPAKTLKYVLRLRCDKVQDLDLSIAELVKHLIPPSQKPPPEKVAVILRLLQPEVQRLVVKAIMRYEKIRKPEAEALGKAIGTSLGLQGLEQLARVHADLPVEVERQMAWGKIKDLILQRKDATVVAAAIRERLNAKYDGDEIRQSWITLTEADPMSLIKIFCQLPYLANGKTDSIARTVMEAYISRLTHEKYAATYNKVVNSLRTMFHAKPDSPTLLNFIALARWANPDAANRLCADVGVKN
ncbi:MAG TPA: hypothetical protein VL361_11375 [Candidatus Limnocylindrales bacterium]|nr:hypothetical protein [Candidatus Limnocylindrales bacterium]